MDNGFVQLPLKTYNELLLDNERMRVELENSVPAAHLEKVDKALDEAIKIEESYGGKLRVKFDPRPFAKYIEALFEETEGTEDYKLYPSRQWYSTDLYSVMEKKEEEDQA